MEVHFIRGRNSIPLECGVKIVHIFVKRFAYCNSEAMSCVWAPDRFVYLEKEVHLLR
jgi:hypothetical protein